jgi:hypothetical protein
MVATSYRIDSDVTNTKRPRASAPRSRPPAPCGVSNPRTIRFASRTARGASATPDLVGHTVHCAGDFPRVVAPGPSMPALERDLQLEVRRQNPLEHTHLFLPGQALNLGGQLLDHLARRCHGSEKNTAELLRLPVKGSARMPTSDIDAAVTCTADRVTLKSVNTDAREVDLRAPARPPCGQPAGLHVAAEDLCAAIVDAEGVHAHGGDREEGALATARRTRDDDHDGAGGLRRGHRVLSRFRRSSATSDACREAASAKRGARRDQSRPSVPVAPVPAGSVARPRRPYARPKWRHRCRRRGRGRRRGLPGSETHKGCHP